MQLNPSPPGWKLPYAVPKTRQLKKALHNFLLTVVCGFTTILVLKGTTGFENAAVEETPHAKQLQILQRDAAPLQRSSELQHARLLAQVQNLMQTKGNPAPSLSHVIIKSENPLHFDSQRYPNNAAVNQNPSKSYSLLPKMSNWDEQRSHWLQENHAAYTNPISNKPSLLLVTGSQPSPCDNPLGDHYLMKSLKNKMDYCRLHNLEIFYNMANLDLEMSGFWAKLPLLHSLMLAHPEKEWLWWMDSDAMFTDMAFELPMERYKDHNLVLHGWEELVFDQKNWIGLNTGSFLIRNCQWSLDLLDAWAPMGPKGKIREEAGLFLSKALVGRPDFEADDQSALIYLLNKQKSKWAQKAYLENAYYLHGYWLIIVEKYEEMMEKYHAGLGDDRWPFVTHFVGCKPCSNTKLSTEDHAAAEKCVKHMERAYNFADNQVLQYYGFQHEALDSYKLKRTNHASHNS